MADKTLVLCFQIDGPYWYDAVYIPAYPAGYSYEKWQFRYRDNWISSDVKSQLTNWRKTSHSLQLDAVLAARFKTGKLQKILPLRKIQITFVDVDAGINNFYFRLGALRDFRTIADLDGSCIDLLQGEWSQTADNNALALYTGADMSKIAWSSPDKEGDSWAKYVDLLATNPNVPLHDDLKGATFVRFSTPLHGEKLADVKMIHEKSAKGNIYGASLIEGNVYSFKIAHKIIRPKGNDNKSAPKITLTYASVSKSIELNEPASEVIGYYQTTPITIGAVNASPSWEDFGITATKEVTKDDGSTKQQELFILPVPLRIKSSWFYRFRSRWVWNVILFLALLIQGVSSFAHDFLSNLLEGKATFSDISHYRIVWIAILISSAAATFAVTGLQERAKLK